MVEFLIHPTNVKSYELSLRRTRQNNNGYILITKQHSVQDSIELIVNVYEGTQYDLLISTDVQPIPTVQKFIAKDIPITLWNDEDYDRVKEAENALESVNSMKKPNYDHAVKLINTLVYHNKQIGYLQYLQGFAVNQQADQYRSNEKLKKALAILDKVGQDITFLPDVRNKALSLAQERYQFLGRKGDALLMGRLLVDLNPSHNYNYLKEYGVSCLMIGQNEEAEKAFRKITEMDPSDGWAQVHLGFAVKSQDKNEECLDHFKIGIESNEPGTKESKFRYHWGDALTRLGRKPEADAMFETAAEAGIFLSKFQRSTYNIDRLVGRPWWKKDDFGLTIRNYIRKLEESWTLIRDEALELMNENFEFPNFEKESEGLQKAGDWRQFTLWQRGMKDKNNCKHTPKTCSIIEPMTEATECRRGQIKFSVMKEGTIVWPHTGPTNCRLRMHLGLKVPPDWQNVNITVADDTRHWHEGQVITFDDSFEHSVTHNGEHYRIILIMDVWHPEMTKNEKLTVSAI